MTLEATTSYGALSRIFIERLFDRFDYDIYFNQEDLLTILISPNGFGKTTMLKIIHNFFTQNFRYFSSLTFTTIELHLNNGGGISITKHPPEEKDEEENSDSVPGEVYFAPLGDTVPDHDTYTYSVQMDERLARAIERRLPVHRVDVNQWLDSSIDKIVTTDQLISHYEGMFPGEMSKSSKIPHWLRNICSSANSHLIETQRLLSLKPDDSHPFSHREGNVKSESVVEKDAEDLSSRILRVVNAYAAESQKLDQTFPKRIIENRSDLISDEANIRQRLRSLGEKRNELVGAGLIGETVGEPISPADDLSDENIRRILSIYVDDTETKISVFDDIYNKVRLFKGILNEHFFFKKIVTDQHSGISAYDIDNGIPLKLSELSSGEQHELVLIYELLFIVNDRAVILIDEPELSLHVGLQRRFVDDLRKIQELRNLQFVIATHSPQIIGEKWNLTEELGYNE